MRKTTTPTLPPDVTAIAHLLTPIGHLMLFSGNLGIKKIMHQPRGSHLTQADQTPDSVELPVQWKHWLDRFATDNLVREACRQLTEYFDHQRNEFDLPLDLSQGTPFQQAVWKTLRDIPFGQTLSYKELAHKLGNENKIRAVGTANGRNPLPLFLPCHRVIGSNGSLTGFAWGLGVKEMLLRHEGYRDRQGKQLSLEWPDYDQISQIPR